jgi:hypothetical protein
MTLSQSTHVSSGLLTVAKKYIEKSLPGDANRYVVHFAYLEGPNERKSKDKCVEQC